jgi:DNA-binding NtrC family response regulator
MTRRSRILVVDDEPLIRAWFSEHLAAAGYDVETAETGAEALRALPGANPELVLLDLRLPDIDGLELLPQLREVDRDLIIIMVTAHGEIDVAVRAVKAGAYQFLEKPLDLEDLLITIEKGLETRDLRQQVAGLRELHRWRFATVELVGRSLVTRKLAGDVERIAATESATVLLLGESGTGKDLVARAIHARSRRSERPMLEINCTALPEHLVESELFGHEPGAFTDARQRKKGLAELADGGTLFLDEIGDMPRGAQAKLLRFLEDSKFKRLGGTTDVSVDVRVIAATNRDLDAAVKAKTFREDLYYRLNVVPIHLTPLRERAEDVAPLALYFVERLARDLKRGSPTLSAEAVEILQAYSWPGNVRELRNVLERALISTDDYAVALPAEGIRLDELERQLIRQALGRTGGNVTRAAKLLGLSRDTLRYRLEKHGLDDPGGAKPADWGSQKGPGAAR